MKTLITTFRFDRDESGYGYYEHLIHNGGVTYFNIPRRNGGVRCKLIDGYVVEEVERFTSFGFVHIERNIRGRYIRKKDYIVGILKKYGEKIYK